MKRSMKPHERQLQIDEMIRREGELSVETLAHRFDVSMETIRRDLTQLADGGRVEKVHGGARRPRLIAEGSFSERLGTEAAAKTRIGRRLADAVEMNETLFIDTGSTTLAAAEFLASIPGLTVITNSWRLAERMDKAGSDAAIYLLGGRYHGDNAETTGPTAIEQIAAFQADRAILTVAAISPEVGAMDASFEEAQVARAMIAHARTVTVLADSSKFGRRAAFSVCLCNEIDLLISDTQLDEAHRTALADMGVEVWH
ncbi:Glycerol-3-phosphate regulon repressor [Hartmannibacter diazotrophicus]|uniref:Glycerol-3-phosphate regulon repressor n=1 Tax=Hartmannibacter diazotrophicus TaxID=1482074 RepID=A0A2C9DBE0_9HYPH|nr:DeoR/GlpR family DNA-binding transcription regulator [Hartmannibacter diazotrophicus]SON57576.1 Glycerol-3-phosphate regulon repressor [Hartmannibacter diazotrophicus]